MNSLTICQSIEDLLPAYALDAIDDADRERIESHLRECSDCRHDIDEYRSVTAMLAFAAPQVEPSASLKQRVLEATVAKPRALRESPSFAANLSTWFTNLFRAPAFSAMTLVFVIALGVWNLSLQNQLAQQAMVNQQMQSDVTRTRAIVSMVAYSENEPKHMQASDVAPQAIGRLVAAPELNSLALIVYDMPTLESKRVYQVWLIDPAGERTSGGTFTVDGSGRAWVLIRAPKPLSSYQGIGITIEPEGGSAKPTTPRVMGTSL
jgi:anti-sigma factor RsiW